MEKAADAPELAQRPAADLPAAAEERHHRRPDNLPAQPTPLVGRDQEIADLLDKLHDTNCRLLTLVGPGGIGKTRLAVAVAAAQEWPVVYAPLQGVASPQFLPPAIADAAGITLAGHEPLKEQLLNYLRGKRLLLILDNFEHLLGGTALLLEILQEAPRVQLLVTSRAALSVREEWLYRVHGLAVPPRDDASDPSAYGAVQLFAERARRVRHDFRPDEEAEAVSAVCRQVEGMPLALELAASWLAVLDCAAIAERLQHSLDILTTPLRNVPERHRSIRAAFDGSWQMLSEEERDIFMQLAVFSGGFSLQAAEEVAGATLPMMSALVTKALLRREANGRYQIHELLRQYGSEKLAASPEREAAVHAAHGAFFMRFLVARRHQVRSPSQRQAAEEIGNELENVHKAWKWALDRQESEMLRNAANVLLDFCQLQSRYLEGTGLFLEASRRLDSDSMAVEQGAAVVEILTHYSWLCLRLGRLADADRALARACWLYNELDVTSNPQFNGNPLLASMFLALTRGENTQATVLGERVLRELAAHTQAVATAIPHYGMASAALAQDDYPRAKAHGTHGLAIALSAGNQWEATFLHSILGQVAVAEEDLLTAKHQYEAAYAICEELAEPGGMAEHLANLANVARVQQAWHEAAGFYRRSHRMYEEIGDRGGIARTKLGLGLVAQECDQLDDAARHFRHALAVAADARVTPLILAVLAAIGEFLAPNEAPQGLGLRVLAFVFQHPTCDARLRREVQDSLGRRGVDADELDPVLDTQEELVAALQAELAAPGKNHMQP